jgi:ribonuclease R
MGDKVKIKIVAANLTKRQLDYEWVLSGPAPEIPTENASIPLGKPKRKKKKASE